MTDRDSTGLDVLLVGLDGVDRAVLQPHLDADRVPTIASILERGAVSDLESQIPPWTPSAWPSLYTGVNPGKHGVFDFLAFDGYDWRLVDRSDVFAHSLWELLDLHGRRSVVVNVPVTSPPRSFDGALVPGYIAPDAPTCHPDGLLAELQAELGDYRVYPPRDIDEAEKREWYRRLVEMRGDAFRYLADRFDPAFGFLQFQQTDTVFHERPDDTAVVADIFEAVDEQLRATIDRCDPDTVFLVSDHGIGPYEGAEFRVNEYLRDIGRLETTTGDGGMPSWTALARERDGTETHSPLQRVLEVASRFGVTSQRLQPILETLRLDQLALRYVSSDTVRAATERVDFPESTAYMRSRTEVGVRLNVAGREPEGVIPASEYDQVRTALMEELRAVESPDGTPVFEQVAPRETFFDGPFTENAVDIVTIPADWQHYLSASLRGERFAEPRTAWNHKRTGIIAAAGEGIDTAVSADAPHLFDVAPTVLSALGHPPSSRMDGRPLDWVEAIDPAAYPPYARADTEPADTGAVEERLAALGYLHTNEH